MGRRARVNGRERRVTNRKYLHFTYTGNILENTTQHFPHGHGTAYYKNGSVYQGDFNFGKKHGYGLLTYEDGSTYEGCFLDNIRSGYAIYKCQCGCVYQGNYKDNRKSGEGTYIDPFENIFKGVFDNNSKNGIGSLTYKSDKSKLSGYWKNDTLDDSENIIYKTQDGIYSGTWSLKEKKLEGEYKCFNGSVIISSWTWTENIEDEPPNFERYDWCFYSNSKGMYYSGYLKHNYPTLENNCFHGFGKLTYEDGSFYEGIFRDGHPTESGWLIDSFGNSYQGQIKDNKPHGLGLEYTQEGLLIKGFFDKGNLVYSILILERSGNYYRGEIKNNDITGQGRYVLASGRSYEGYFKNGERVGVHLRTSSRGVQSKKEFGITYLD
jgi:hypothetical protein